MSEIASASLFSGLLKLRFVLSSTLPARVVTFTHDSGLAFRADLDAVMRLDAARTELVLDAVRDALSRGLCVPCSVDFQREVRRDGEHVRPFLTVRLNPIPEHASWR